MLLKPSYSAFKLSLVLSLLSLRAGKPSLTVEVALGLKPGLSKMRYCYYVVDDINAPFLASWEDCAGEER